MGRDNNPRQSESIGLIDQVSRRDYLKLGAAGVGGSMLGLSGSSMEVAAQDDYYNLASEVPDRAMNIWESKPDVRQEYDTVDASDYDNRSGDLAELIEQASSQGAIVDLGSGTYEMNSEVNGSNLVGVVGDGSSQATIYYQGTHLEYLFYLSNVSTGVLEGVTFDITETTSDGFDTDVGVLRGEFSNEFWAEDVVLRGSRHRYQDTDGDGNYETVGARFTFRVDMASGAESFIHKCRFPDGGTDMRPETGETHGHAIGPNADPPHEGYNVWKDVYVSGFYDNGFYVSNSNGANILWNCHAENNATSGMRVSWNDTIVGGTTEVTEELPGAWQGTPLVHDRGDNVDVIGLEILADGDSWGTEGIQIRSEARAINFEKTVLHIRGGDSRPVRAGSDYDVDVTLDDIYWYDEVGAGNYMFYIAEPYAVPATVTTDNADTCRIYSEGNTEFNIGSDGELVVEGQSYSNQTLSASDLGLGDPTPLPDFYFDYGDSDFTVDAGVYSESGSTTSSYRYNTTELVSLVEPSGYGDPIAFGANHRSTSTSAYQGIQIEPNESIKGVQVQIDPDSSGISHATIRDTSGNILAEEDLSGASPGDYVDIEYDLQPGTAYHVVLGDNGNIYTRGSSSESFPMSSDELSVTAGVYTGGGSTSSNNRYNVTEVRAITGYAAGSSVAFGADERGGSVSAYQGIQVNPNESLGGFRVQIDPDSSGISHATIRDTSGNILAEEDVSGANPGDYVDINHDLDAGTDYLVVLGNYGSTYSRGSSSESYPIGTGDFDVTAGVYSETGSTTSSYRYNLTEIEAIPATTTTGQSVNFNADSRGGSVSAYQGVRVDPNTALKGLRAQIDPDSSGISHATIRDTSGNILAEKDVSGANPGDYVDIEYDLQAGTKYLVVFGNHGSTYSRGSSGASYPTDSS